MVTISQLRRALLPVIMASVCVPCGADGLLEQLQAEISGIAARTRSAVVTIADARAVVAAYDTSTLKKQEIDKKIADLYILTQDADTRLTRMVRSNAAGAADRLKVDEAKHMAERLKLQIAAQQRIVGELGHISQLQLAIEELKDRLALCDNDKQFEDQRVAHLNRVYTSENPMMKEALSRQAEADRVRTQVKQELIDLEQSFAAAKSGKRQGGDADTTAGQVAAVLNRAYSDPPGQEAPKSGTGFSIGDGYVVTTADVLQGMKSPIVVTDSGLQLRAVTVGVDTQLNVGLLKLATDVAIPALKLGDSDRLAPGHFVISIGNQSGQNNVIALNLVSGFNTSGVTAGSHFYPRLIEIGGTVGSGASGAPLVDAKGEVIGILAGVPADDVSSPFQNSQVDWQFPNTTPAYLGTTGINYDWSKIYTNGITTTWNPTSLNAKGNSTAWDRSSADWIRAMTHGGQSKRKSSSKKSQTAPRRSNAKPAHRQSKARSTGNTAYVTYLFTPGSGKSAGVPLNYTGSGVHLQNVVPAFVYVNGASPWTNTATYLSRNVVPQATYSTAYQLGSEFAKPANQYPYSPTGAYQDNTKAPASTVTSAGFAIPINDLKASIDDLRAGRAIQQVWLGIQMTEEDVPSEQNGVILIAKTVRISAVYPDSPAAKAGIQPGETLSALGERSIHSSADVREIAVHLRTGDTMKARITRGGVERDVTLTIQVRPQTLKPPITEPAKGER